MKRFHLAAAAALLVVCTYGSVLLPIEHADAQGGFSKEQRRVLSGKQEKGKAKAEGKKRGKWKGKMKGKWKGKMKRRWKRKMEREKGAGPL